MHVIIRSDRFWTGLPTDLVIEQDLMRCLKTTGGLTDGSGITEVLSRPTCSALNLLIEGVSQVIYGTSEHHKEMSEPRQPRDCKDTQIVINLLEKGSSFNGDLQLRKITNDLTAYEPANVDSARDLGLKPLTPCLKSWSLIFYFDENNRQFKLLQSRIQVENAKD
jgi:hypothetical protein